MILVWLWGVLPSIAQTFTVSKLRPSVADQGPYSALSVHSAEALTFVVVGYSLFVILTRITEVPRTLQLSLLVMLLPWAIIVTRDLYIYANLNMRMCAYPLLMVAFWISRPRLQSLATMGYLVGFTAALSIFVGTFMPESGIFRSANGDYVDADKALVNNSILVGVFTGGNTLGQFLLLGLPMVFLIRRRLDRNIVTGLCLFALMWSASRTSLISIGFLIVAFVTYASVPPIMKRTVSVVLMSAALFAAGLVPFISFGPQAFSNRGSIWTASLDAVGNHMTFGLGGNWYQEIAGTTSGLGSTVFYAHNQFLQLLVTGGLVFAASGALCAAVLVGCAGKLLSHGELFGFCYVIALAGACLMEAPIVFDDRSALAPVTLIPIALLVFARPSKRERDLSLILSRSDDERSAGKICTQ